MNWMKKEIPPIRSFFFGVSINFLYFKIIINFKKSIFSENAPQSLTTIFIMFTLFSFSHTGKYFLSKRRAIILTSNFMIELWNISFWVVSPLEVTQRLALSKNCPPSWFGDNLTCRKECRWQCCQSLECVWSSTNKETMAPKPQWRVLVLSTCGNKFYLRVGLRLPPARVSARKNRDEITL